MDPILIHLGVDANNAAESVAQFVNETKKSIEKAYTDSVDKAQKKLDELTRKQETHQQVIAETGKQITELQTKRDKASQAEQSNIDQEVKKLQQLIQTRTLDVNAIEQKKQKVEEQGLLSLSSNEAERQALKQVTDSRLVELGTLRDQLRATAAIRDTSATAMAQIKSDVDSLTHKQSELNLVIAQHQQKIASLQQLSTTSSAAEKDRIEQEIAGLQKAVQSRSSEIAEIDTKKIKLEEQAAIMSSTSDAEREQIKQNTDARLANIAVLQDSTKAQNAVKDSHAQMASEASAEIESLMRKQQVNTATVEADRKKIEELRITRKTASTEAKQQIDEEITSLTKIINVRQQENLEIESKKIALEGEIALSAATTDEEISGIQAVTSQRLVENNTVRDHQKAQAAANTTTKEGTGVVGNYIASFAGMAGVVAIVRVVTQALQAERQELEGILSTGNKIRDLQTGEFDKLGKFFNEAELFEGNSQQAGKALVEGVAKSNNLEIGTVADTAADLAPTLAKAGITVTGNADRFADIVGNVSRFKNRGFDTSVMSNFAANFLKDHPDATGADFNQELSNLLAKTGSAKRANALMQVFNEQQTKFEGVKFSYGDVEKVYEAFQQNGIAPEGIPTAAKQFFQSADRLVGLSPEEKEQKLEEMGERGLTSLMPYFETDKPVDVRGLAEAIDKLPRDQQEQAARMIGGPRNVVAAIAASSWTGKGKLPIANYPLMPAPTDAAEIAKAQKEQADLALANSEDADPAKTEFQTQEGKAEQDIQRHPEGKPWYQRGIWASTVGKLAVGTTDDKENAAINTYGRRLLRQARLLAQIDSGQTKASPEQRQAILDSMSEIRDRIDPAGSGWTDQSDVLGKLIKGGQDTSDVLSTITSDDAFIAGEASHFDRSDNLQDDRVAAPIFDRANRAYNAVTGETTPVSSPTPRYRPPAPPTTTPTTRPSSPVSINVNNRIVNYAYGADSIGAVQDHANNYG